MTYSVKMPNILRTLAKLLTDFKNSRNVTVVDFIENALRVTSLTENEGQHFLHLAKVAPFLEKLAKNFKDTEKLRRINEINVVTLLYFVIFVLDQKNYNVIVNVDMFYIDKLLIYLINEYNHLLFAKIACKMFENSYVLDRIMYPLLDKVELIEAILEKIEEDRDNRIVKKSPTVPQEFEFLKRVHAKPPAPPVNTPEGTRRKLKHYPSTKCLYINLPKKKLEEAYAKNKKRAQELLEEAQKIPSRLLETRKVTYPLETETKTFKAKKMPQTKDVEIKGNLTSALREASRLVKEQEDEIRKIEEVMRGGATGEVVELLEAELREEQHQIRIDDVERKHLQGLLTHEESILAKQRLLEQNKEKMQEFKTARAELLEKLELWKKEEQEKIKYTVEKSQKIRENSRDAGRKLHEEKQQQVKILQLEAKEMLRKACEEKQKELVRKAKLIEEIKTLHQIRVTMNVKEFDPTDCPHLGLLCEMSIAELQERLVMAKMNMEEQLKEKRQRVVRRRQEQQEMLENVRNFIKESRSVSRTHEPLPAPTVNVERSPDIDELRKRLQEKRGLRMELQKENRVF